MSVVRGLTGPVSMAVVLVVVVLVGAGLFDAPAPAAAARVAALERLVRCPSCTDLSVAQSNAPSSIAVRDEIAQKVRAGRSDTEILDGLQDRYGPSILLVPPSGGLTTVLWAAPVALAAAAAAGGAAVVLRRRREARP